MHSFNYNIIKKEKKGTAREYTLKKCPVWYYVRKDINLNVKIIKSIARFCNAKKRYNLQSYSLASRPSNKTTEINPSLVMIVI